MKIVNVYGAGGHAKVIVDILLRKGYTIGVVYDDNASIDLFLGYKVQSPQEIDCDTHLIIALGENKTRKQIAQRGTYTFLENIAHSSAIISANVIIGKGTVIMAGAVLNTNVKVGAHCIINSSSVVEHDVCIGDFVHIAPNSTITGGVQIGEGTIVGAGAVVAPNVTIGKEVTIGAGTIVINDIPDYATVVGNPGRILK